MRYSSIIMTINPYLPLCRSYRDEADSIKSLENRATEKESFQTNFQDM